MSLRDDVERVLRAALSPTRVEIHDDSHAHAGHGASGAHVRVLIESPAFSGKSSLQRHRMINELLKAQLASGAIHALQISAKAPGES